MDPLDLDACRENLDTYATQGDARSCRDIALAALAEAERLRTDATNLRVVDGHEEVIAAALRRTGSYGDEAYGVVMDVLTHARIILGEER